MLASQDSMTFPMRQHREHATHYSLSIGPQCLFIIALLILLFTLLGFHHRGNKHPSTLPQRLPLFFVAGSLSTPTGGFRSVPANDVGRFDDVRRVQCVQEEMEEGSIRRILNAIPLKDERHSATFRMMSYGSLPELPISSRQEAHSALPKCHPTWSTPARSYS